MIDKRFFYSVAACALLFVGAGCSTDQRYQADLENGQQPSEEQAQGDASENAKIDASMKALLEASSAENGEQSGEEQTAGRADDDEAEINAYGQAEYEAK